MKKFFALAILMMATQAQAERPEEIFPEKLDGLEIKGVFVRKGTIGASFINASLLDKLFSQGGSEQEIKKIMQDQEPLGRGLYVLDLFEMLPIKMWLTDQKRQGRILVAIMTMQKAPELLTNEVKERLKQLRLSSHPIVQGHIDALISGA